MKKNIKIITGYSKKSGFGNLQRSKNLFFFLKSRHKVKFFLISNKLDFINFKKKMVFIENFKDLIIMKDDYLFIDVPNIKKEKFEYLAKSTNKILFYGKNNYFNKNNERIYPFKNKYYNMNYSIINIKQKKIKYNFSKKIKFLIYFGKKINEKIIKGIIKTLNNLKINFEIRLFYPYANNLKKFIKQNQKIKVIKSFNKIDNNTIFIGNSGSGSYDRVNSGIISVNYSYNRSENLIGMQLQKFTNCFYFMGNISKFHSSNLNKLIKKILNNRGKNSSKSHGIFANNNKNIEKIILK